MKSYEILLATNNRNMSTNFVKVSFEERVKIDTINTPAQLNKIFQKKGKILDVLLLDLTFPEHDLNRFIFYVKQFKKDMPVILLKVDHGIVNSEKEALRNLSVYASIIKPSTRQEAEEILQDLNNILGLDMDKKLDKVAYLEKENVFACTFKNGKTYFLQRKDIPEDDASKIKHYVIDNDNYYFTVYLESGKEYIILWDYILSLCEEKYDYYKNKEISIMSSKEIGKRIKIIRNKRSLTQKDMESKTGILRANIARIENGKHSSSLETLEKIASALQVPVAALLSK